jgi:regulator of Ty1 transposition protein 103
MSFSETSLYKKFNELNSTQQSVQTLSLWLIHHRKHSHAIVKTWLKELVSATKPERKLTFIYLANDILQNSRKKGNEYMKEFTQPLNEAIENTAKYSDEKIRFTLERILNIWKDRKIYADEKIDELKKILHSTPSMANLRSPPLDESPKKSNKKSSDSKPSEDDIKKRKTEDINENAQNNADHNKSAKNATSLKEEVVRELSSQNIPVPDSNELINLLQDLESSASSDAIVRKKIAELPQKVKDLNELKNIHDRNEAIEFAHVVNDAISLVDTYNSRLQQELVNRKQTALKLAVYIREQKAELEQDEKMIEEWQKKLKNAINVRNDLKVHLDSLPDLSSIEEAAELIPLPSAGDLFASKQ